MPMSIFETPEVAAMKSANDRLTITSQKIPKGSSELLKGCGPPATVMIANQFSSSNCPRFPTMTNFAFPGNVPLCASMAPQSALSEFFASKGRLLRLAPMRSRIMWRDSLKVAYLAGNIIDPAFPTSRPRRFRTRHAGAVSNEPVVEAEFIKLLQSLINLLDRLQFGS
jgi:hypothetical protein